MEGGGSGSVLGVSGDEHSHVAVVGGRHGMFGEGIKGLNGQLWEAYIVSFVTLHCSHIFTDLHFVEREVTFFSRHSDWSWLLSLTCADSAEDWSFLLDCASIADSCLVS